MLKTMGKKKRKSGIVWTVNVRATASTTIEVIATQEDKTREVQRMQSRLGFRLVRLQKSTILG
jgi:IS1 family transposase